MSDWIDVKDKLPKDGERVIVWAKIGFNREFEAGSCMYSSDRGFYHMDYSVHFAENWMPLPKPPK